MAKKRRSRTKSRSRRAAAQPAPRVQLPPEPRPHFHYELRAERSGDYEIQLSLLDEPDGSQSVQARVRAPGAQAVEVERRTAAPAGTAPVVSDARAEFGIPEGIPGALVQEMLWDCRKWVHQEDARRRAEKRKSHA